MLLLLIGGMVLAVAAVICETFDLKACIERASLHPVERGIGDRRGRSSSLQGRAADELTRGRSGLPLV